MENTMWDLEVKMLVPFDVMIYYPDDYKDDYIVEPSFKKIMEFMKIEIDLPVIIEDLYKNRGKNSSISVYYSYDSYKNFILLDTDIEPSDQLDLIIICIRCDASCGEVIRQFAHEFYTKRCKYNVVYSEGNFEIRDKYKIDFSSYSQLRDSDFIHIENRRLYFYQSGKLLKSITT
ncbi:MAG: hypothetical protein N2645_22485 [Clostridia bacterium]|nr:hypothetical protein [Clostridia bacterium]